MYVFNEGSLSGQCLFQIYFLVFKILNNYVLINCLTLLLADVFLTSFSSLVIDYTEGWVTDNRLPGMCNRLHSAFLHISCAEAVQFKFSLW